MIDSEFLQELGGIDLSGTPLVLVKLIKRAIVIAQNNAWQEGGTEYTLWSVCTGCGQADWRGHSDNCEVEKFLKDAHSLLEKLESIGG